MPCAVPENVTVSLRTEPDEGEPKDAIIRPILTQLAALEIKSPSPTACASMTTAVSSESYQSSGIISVNDQLSLFIVA